MKIEDLQKNTACCYGNSFINDKIKDILECTILCCTQININSDQIFIQFSLFMIKLNSTWGYQLASGHQLSIQH